MGRLSLKQLQITRIGECYVHLEPYRPYPRTEGRLPERKTKENIPERILDTCRLDHFNPSCRR